MDGPTFNQEFLNKLGDGDHVTTSEFFTHFTSTLGAQLRSHGLTSQIIDEIRQETLLRVYRRIKQSEPIENLAAYVRGVCKNVVHEYQRAEWRYQGMPEEMTDLPDLSPHPEAGWITEESLAAVRLAMEQLSEKDRTLLRQVFLESRDKDEVCRELGVKREYLRVLLHRATTSLKKILKQ